MQSFQPINNVAGQLRDASKTWTVTVLGDSTGADDGRWVHRLVERMAEETGRPATIHDWSVESNTYSDTTDIPGEGEPIVVWNGSASGKDTGYTMEHLAKMAPNPSDLVIISHGHNQGGAKQTTGGIQGLAGRVKQAWDTTPAVAITLQNPRFDDNETRQEEIIQSIRSSWGGAKNIALIDVFSAFRDSENVDDLRE